MKHRIAFAGFRHPHIRSLWDLASRHPECEIVGACETDSATREELIAEGKINLTHENYAEMLSEIGCSIIAVGDVYARRGAIAIAALRAGKHVISDKPICTSLVELEEIASLSKEHSLSVGCQLDLIESPVFRKLRELIRGGALGTICTITISAQHPLRFGSRVAWYFEPGQHGGTINDIGIHVADLVPWLIGRDWDKVLSSRNWNAKAVETPHFLDCAQLHATLVGGAACFADLSYLAPDDAGYGLPQYWRITVHGTEGCAETSYGSSSVSLTQNRDSAAQTIPADQEASRNYFQDFLDEIDGQPAVDGLTTKRVLAVSEWTLRAQEIAFQTKL